MAPETAEEKIVWYAITWLYPLYLLGALYVSGPIVGWLLFLIWCYRFFLQPSRYFNPTVIPMSHWCWVVAMLMMLLTLFVGHLINNLGLIQLIKSSLGWAKGWALMALFVLAGGLQIRTQLIIRACMTVCQHSLLLIPVFIIAWLLGFPQTLYVSPLQIIGGPGPEFFAVSLYEIDPGSGLPRWRLFTPWAPALGFVANMFFLFALKEPERYWRIIGITSSVLMILMSQSRLAAICFIALTTMHILVTRFKGSQLFALLSLAAFAVAFIAPMLLEGLEELYQSIKSARADSSRVRAALARIAVERWWSEAPVWGHGVVERGPHLVEYMPIGSHHTWYGLLFVKGIIGFLALAIPMTVSLVTLIVKNCSNACHFIAIAGLSMLLLYTFGENLEILAYFFWPILIIMGQAHRLNNEANLIFQRRLAND